MAGMVRARSLAEAFDPSANGITLLRLGLALLVVFSHAFVVGGFGPDPGMRLSHGRTQLGTVAVMGFLVLGGFLVTRSRLTTNTPGFVWRRFLRVMPGYWVCIVVTVAIIAPVAALVGHGDATPADLLRYLGENALLVQFELFIGDVFTSNPWSGTVNGSLWTLAPEVACYLALLCIPRRWLRLLTPGLVVGLAGAHLARTSGLAPMVLAVDFPLAFSLGGAAWLFRDHIRVDGRIAAIALAGVIVSIWAGAFVALGIPFTAYLVLWLAVAVRRPMRTDLSYGVYIYAFPLQQLAVTLGLHALGFGPFLVVSASAALAVASLSWHFVERPAMDLRAIRLTDVVARIRAVGSLVRSGAIAARGAPPES